MPTHTEANVDVRRHDPAIATLPGKDVSALRKDSPRPDMAAPAEWITRGLLMKCPSCGRRMELDPGFAGSVCRCIHCKALIAVPKELLEANQPMAGPGDRPESPQIPLQGTLPRHSPTLPAMSFHPPEATGWRIPLPQSQEMEIAKVAAKERDPFATIASQYRMTPPTQESAAISFFSSASWSLILGIAAGIGLLIALAISTAFW